jgi:alkylation response protein AidB-like acyl-CoA dehydrogenase
MNTKWFSKRNLEFVLYDVHSVDDVTKFPHYSQHDREIFDLVLETAEKMGRDQLGPLFQEMDQESPVLDDGQVKVHARVKELMEKLGEGGWIAAKATYEMGGQQLPEMLSTACAFIFSAANYSASVYPMLTRGAAHLITEFGSEELREKFVSKMFAGKWQGTMALTEPQAGSSLTDIATQAELAENGFYKIKGQKMFISAGDHDGVDNIIHLMLARIKGAPPGVRGISLFAVPKKRSDGDEALVFNDVTTAAIYHKLGYRGCPITQLSFGENDDCRGYLVGEPHKGLNYMFQMMNEARIEVGVGAAGIASAAYYASLEYAGERPQGRKPGSKDPSQPPVMIIEHPDVRRMLLFQRAVVEGSLSLLLQCGKYADLRKVTEGEERDKYSRLLDLLTPVAKTYPSEMGVLSVSQGLQILGGYGYCDEFPLEQHYRDMRIHPIHEGTTGIHGLDLLGRKVVSNDGKNLSLYFDEVQKAVSVGLEDADLAIYAQKLSDALADLMSLTSTLVSYKDRLDYFLADATLYLELFGIITVAWQWLLQGIAAKKGLRDNLIDSKVLFYQGKLVTMKYFFHYELPKRQGLSERLKENDGLTVEIDESAFFD